MTEDNDNVLSPSQNEMISVIDSLLDKIKENDATITEHQTIATTTGNLTNQVVEVLQRVINDMQSGDDAVEKLTRSLDVLTTLVSSLESNRRSVEDEAIKVAAIQEGMRRALTAVRITSLQPKLNPNDGQSGERGLRSTSVELP